MSSPIPRVRQPEAVRWNRSLLAAASVTRRAPPGSANEAHLRLHHSDTSVREINPPNGGFAIPLLITCSTRPSAVSPPPGTARGVEALRRDRTVQREARIRA